VRYFGKHSLGRQNECFSAKLAFASIALGEIV